MPGMRPDCRDASTPQPQPPNLSPSVKSNASTPSTLVRIGGGTRVFIHTHAFCRTVSYGTALA